MKICPQCQATYDDDAGLCAEDGSVLVREGEPNNPMMHNVVPIDESAETRMLDVESLRDDLGGDLPDPQDLATTLPDSDSTKMLSQQEVDRVLKETKEASRARIERTQHTRAPGHGGSGRGSAAALIAVMALLLLVGAGALVLLWPSPTALRITTAPSGAEVELDGVLSGHSPVKVEIDSGTHSVTLRLDGYHAFAQVVDVPSGGRNLTVALVKQKIEVPVVEADPEQALKARANAIFTEVEALMDVGKYDAAESRLQVLAVMVPGDGRVADFLKRVADAREKAEASGKPDSRPRISAGADPRPESLNRREREKLADKFFRLGQAKYRAKNFAAAKQNLIKALGYDARFYPPHRVLARIYNRENNTAKAKYHLTRYIELGGADTDYKIRQWLATH